MNTLLLLLLLFLSKLIVIVHSVNLNDFGKEWNLTTAPIQDWNSIALSQSGQFLCAVETTSGGIFVSLNHGDSWNQASTPALLYFWDSAICDDGQYMYAIINGGGIYKSENYGGKFSLTTAPDDQWNSIAVSGSGQYIFATISSGGIYMSYNYGSTFSQTVAVEHIWYALAISNDSKYCAASFHDDVGGGGIYLSSNYGVSWNVTSAPNMLFMQVAMSYDGKFMVSVVDNLGGIYLSTNYGVDWRLTTAPNNMNWFSVSMSGNGQYIAAAISGEGIYTSVNYGATWNISNSSLNKNCYSLAMSDSAQYMAFVVLNGGIYISEYNVSFETTNSPLMYPTESPTHEQNIDILTPEEYEFLIVAVIAIGFFIISFMLYIYFKRIRRSKNDNESLPNVNMVVTNDLHKQ